MDRGQPREEDGEPLMSISLRILLGAIAVAFSVAVIRQVSRGHLRLKYALMWLVVALALVIGALFPGIVGALAHLLGFGLASNMVLLLGILVILCVCFALTMIVSWQARDIRTLIQHVSLLETELHESKEDAAATAASDADDAAGAADTTPTSDTTDSFE